MEIQSYQASDTLVYDRRYYTRDSSLEYYRPDSPDCGMDEGVKERKDKQTYRFYKGRYTSPSNF